MTDDHDRYRDWSAAYVLGALEPSERADYERHLRSCDDCQADVKDLAAFPALLARVDPGAQIGSDPATDRITELALARATTDYSRLHTARRRWRVTAIAAVAAAVLLVVGIGVARLADDGPPVGTELVLDTAATGSVTVDERAWGTSIEVNLRGLPQRDSYQLWAIDTDGAWVPAATWTATPGGVAKLTGAADLATDYLDQVIITSADRNDVLVLATN